MDNNEITITQALNHLQSWLNAGEFDKVLQGAKEILELEPENQRALALMRIAAERAESEAGGGIGSDLAPAPVSQTSPAEPVTPTTPPQQQVPPTISPISSIPQSDPLIASLQVEDAPSQLNRRIDAMNREKISHLLAMMIPALIVVVIGGSLIWFLSNRNNQNAISDIEDQEPTPSKEYLQQNEERVLNLVKIAEVLEKYKKENGVYPSVREVDDILKESGFWTGVPTDPRNGEKDNAGNVFGYIYAVYDSHEGPNTDYIISAIFEDGKGYAYPWSRGTSTNAHPDYRNLDASNVHMIASDGKPGSLIQNPAPTQEPYSSEDGPKVKVKR